MAEAEKFSDYLFTKMGPSIQTGHNVAGPDVECSKTTGNCEAPVELTGLRKWLSKNLMLLVTLSGVIFGVIEGELTISCECYLHVEFR